MQLLECLLLGALATATSPMLHASTAHADTFPDTTTTANGILVGNVRVQALSATLVRIEPKGPMGFEDRSTLVVQERRPVGVPLTKACAVHRSDSYQPRIILHTHF